MSQRLNLNRKKTKTILLEPWYIKRWISYPSGVVSSEFVLFLEARAIRAWLLEKVGKKLACDGKWNGKNGPKAALSMRGSIGKCGARVAGAGEVASDWWPNGNGCSGCL